ncbi:MAG TPA: GAF domain-containing protein, partial [Anaerolineales bacterium]
MKTALAIKRTAEYRQAVLAAFERAGIECTISSVASLSRPNGAAVDVIVLDAAASGALAALKANKFTGPIILLVEPRSEADAVGMLEQGLIADYSIAARAQIARLPHVVRAVAARAVRAAAADRAAARPTREELQGAVFDIAREADQAETLDSLLPKIHAIVGRVMPATNFYIALHNPTRDSITFVYFVDEMDELTTPEVSTGTGLTAYVLRTGKSLRVNNQEQREILRGAGVEASGTPSAIWLGVPLIVDRAAIGVMAVQHYRDPSAYGEVEQKVLEFVSSQVATVIRRKQVYDALRASEEGFRSAFENATVGISRSAPDGQIIYANPAFVRMLGFRNLDELRSRSRSAEGVADGFMRKDFIERITKDGEVRGFESVWVRADGSRIYVRESARAVRSADGTPLYFEGIVEDISERKSAEMAVQEKVHALESLAEIDREILAAEDAHAILNLVCERIATLLKAARAAIITKQGPSGEVILASYGFAQPTLLERDFENAVSNGLLAEPASVVVAPATLAAGSRKVPYFSELIQREKLKAMVIEGFYSAEDLQGALLVFDTQARAWTEDEMQLVRLLAGQAALALAKVQLLSDARRRASQFSGLYQIAVELMSSRDLPSLMSMIVQKASELHSVPSAFIYLYDEKSTALDLAIVTGIDIKRPLRPKLGEGMAGRVAESREVLMVNDYSAWPHQLGALKESRFAAVLEVPMLYQGHLIGVLGIAEIDDSNRK